jgi:hypothetical protein
MEEQLRGRGESEGKGAVEGVGEGWGMGPCSPHHCPDAALL